MFRTASGVVRFFVFCCMPRRHLPPFLPHAPDTLETDHPGWQRWRWWLRNFWPAPVGIGVRESWRMALGITIGLLVTGLLSRWWDSGVHPIWMVSSLGASAVLLFGMPGSPLAQPWPVLGGTVVSATIGALCLRFLPDPVWACAVAVGLSVVVMVPLRCMHPPGAGIAALVVLDGINGMQLLLFPILFNVVVLVACAVVYNGLTGRRYPSPQQKAVIGAAKSPFSPQDLDIALKHYNQVLDISRADLEGLLQHVSHAAFQRTLGSLRCADIMTSPVFAVTPEVPLKDAWALMRQERVKALPVMNNQRHVVGMLSQTDFMRHAQMDVRAGWGQRVRRWISGSGMDKDTVASAMDHHVQPVPADTLVMALLPLLSQGGVHHLPVVDAQQTLQGIVTQTDLIRALGQAVAPPAAA